MGRVGQKAGKGWFLYDDERKPIPDPEVVDVDSRRPRASAGIPQRTFTDEEIVERCIYALVNEGARILEEGFAAAGVGHRRDLPERLRFPGLARRPDVLSPIAPASRPSTRASPSSIVTLGDRWAPAPLLAQLAASGRTFRDRDRHA